MGIPISHAVIVAGGSSSWIWTHAHVDHRVDVDCSVSSSSLLNLLLFSPALFLALFSTIIRDKTFGFYITFTNRAIICSGFFSVAWRRTPIPCISSSKPLCSCWYIAQTILQFVSFIKDIYIYKSIKTYNNTISSYLSNRIQNCFFLTCNYMLCCLL